MKLLNKYLISVAAISMVACSSMDISDSEAVSENFPSDFNNAEYAQLHPELVSLQIRDYVKSHNAAVKNAQTNEQIAADQAAFEANMDLLHEIMVNPIYAGYSETYWENLWLPVVSEKTTCGKKFVTLNVQKLVASAEAESGVDTIDIKLQEPITVEPAGVMESDKMVHVSGMVDSVLQEFDIGDSVWVMKGSKMGSSVVDSSACVTVPDSVPGTGPQKNDITFLKNFNFTDTEDDLAALREIKIDTLAISLQYSMFGRDNGWAYRKCTEAEAGNPAITEVYPVTKLYCVDDSGVVREIK